MPALIAALVLFAGGRDPVVAAPAGGVAARDASAVPHRSLATRNVILVTVDGVRIQEMFGGMDEEISKKEKHSGIEELAKTRSRYWRPTPAERRLALMPFFWGRLVQQGIILGDKEEGSSVHPRNPLLFSAPGYAEILTGQYQPDVTTNDVRRYPHPTVLEYVHRELKLGKTQVATIGSWDAFKTLSSSQADAFFTNGGYEKIPAAMATPRMAYLGELQDQIMALWEAGRSDAVTFNLALEYLKKYRPRLLYIALGEPDDWAHARRYDRLLDYLHVLDDYLRALWQALEVSDFYRGRTTLIITTDHGRGVRPDDWVEHEEGIAGSEDIWVAVIGPDTPHLGLLAPYPTVHQADIAATLARFFGLDFRKLNPEAGPPIPAAFGDPPPASSE